MARFKHFEFLILKDKSASDSAQVPAASASVTVYKQGAIANGGGSVAEGGSGTITVHDPGGIRSGDIVFVGTTTAVTALAGTVTATTVPISGVAGGIFTWSDGSRIVPNTGAPTLFSDSAGVDSVANPLTTSARGIAEAWADAESVWHIQSGSGVTTALFVDFGGDGGTRFRSDELDRAAAVAYVFDTREALGTAGAKMASFRTAGAERASLGRDGTLIAPRLGPESALDSGGALRIVDGVKFALTGAGIQAAIDDLPTAGGTVLLPAGTISVSTQITVPSGVHVRGSGWATILQRASGSDLVNGLFYLNASAADVTDVCISDMKIDINGTVGLLTTSNAFCVEMRAAGANRIRRCWVERCRLVDGWIGAVSCVGGEDCWIADNMIQDCGRHTTVGSTPVLLSGATDSHVARNTFRNNMKVNATETSSFVVDLTGACARCEVSANVIINTSADGQGEGIRVRGTSAGCVVSGNTVDGLDLPGIRVEGVVVADVTDTVVSSNVVRNCGLAPVNTNPCIKEGSTRCVLIGNTMSGAAANNGIECNGDDSTVLCNSCSNITNTTNGQGLYLSGNRKVAVGNVCNRNGLTGITAENLDYAVIALNTMLDNGGATAGDGLKFASAPVGVTYTMVVGNNIGDTRSGASRTQRLGFNNSLGGQPATGSQAFGNLSENNITSDFADWPNAAGVMDWLNLTGTTPAGAGSGSFTCAAAATTTVSNTRVRAASRIFIWPTNAAAATLESGAKKLYTSAKTAGASFAVTTQDGTAAAGTETFDFIILP